MRPFVSRFQMLEVPMPVVGSQIGVTFKVENVNRVEPRRTVNGALLVVQSPFPRKVRISVSASGKAVQAEPAWAAVQLGGQVTVQSPKSMTAFLLPGQTSVLVHHDIVPGSNVVAADGQGRPVTATWAGRTISIAAAAATLVTLRWRPVYVCGLVSHFGDATKVEGGQGWDAVLEEM